MGVLTLNKLLIGPLPPPSGGVSVHLLRYSVKYNTTVIQPKELKRWIRDTKKWKTVKQIILLRNHEIFVHSNHWYIFLLLIIKSVFIKRNCAFYYIKHSVMLNEIDNRNVKSKIVNIIFRWFLHRCEKVFVVNTDVIPDMKELYGELNYTKFDPFVPPPEDQEEIIMNMFTPELHKFLDQRHPIISSCAWRLTFYNNEDLYGFDLLIELIAEIKNQLPEIGLIFFISDPEFNKEYLLSCRRRIVELDVEDNFLIVTGHNEFWPIIKYSNLFIRATNTDGDPLTIKEAQHFGVNVLASDCTDRIEGVEMFKSRDIQSLIHNTLQCLSYGNGCGKKE